MADSQEVHTGGGSAIQGSVNTGGGEFVGRDLLSEQITATGNVVNVNLPPTWNPAVAHGQDLSVNAEERLSQDIRELRQTITGLATTVGNLDKTLSMELQSANDRIDGMQNLFNEIIADRNRLSAEFQAMLAEILKRQEEAKPMFDEQTSRMLVIIGIIIVLLLGVIAWGTMVRSNAAAMTMLLFWIGFAV